VATYLYFNRGRSNAGQNPIINNFNTILQAQPNFWDVVIMSVLNGLLFGSSNTVWDLSRSLYPIHLLSPLSIERYLSQTMSNQSQGVITKLVNDTKILTSNLDYSLVDVARDEFSKKTVMWRKNVLSYVQLWECKLWESTYFGLWKCLLEECMFKKHNLKTSGDNRL